MVTAERQQSTTLTSGPVVGQDEPQHVCNRTVHACDSEVHVQAMLCRDWRMNRSRVCGTFCCSSVRPGLGCELVNIYGWRAWRVLMRSSEARVDKTACTVLRELQWMLMQS